MRNAQSNALSHHVQGENNRAENVTHHNLTPCRPQGQHMLAQAIRRLPHLGDPICALESFVRSHAECETGMPFR
jgi:hypothetical protein